MTRRWLIWALVGALPVLVLLLLVQHVIHDPDLVGPMFHFYIVSFITLVALLLAILMSVAAGELQDVRIFFLALAFIGVSGIFLVHALTTPGAIVPSDNLWAGMSARLAFLVGAFFFALSTREWPSSVQESIMARRGRIIGIFVACIAAYGAVGMIDAFAGAGASPANDPVSGYASMSMTMMSSMPGMHGPHVMPVYLDASNAGHPLDWLLSPAASWIDTLLVLGLLGLVIVRYTRLFRLSRTPLVGGFLVSAVFLAQGQLSMTMAPPWHASWWEYHVLVLAGFTAATFGLVREYARSGSLQGVVEGLLLRGTIAQLQRGYTDVIVALVGAVEAKDPYTRGHTQRVAELSVRIGQELRLSPERLRVLNQSAMLHDIGKIGIPDQVLHKPGPLTDEEFAIVREHPARGHAIIQHVRSLRQEIDGVRYHHERLDGSGYPDGLRGDEIPLEARIIAVADVFDALTSRRSYRDAWPFEQALNQLDSEAGPRLDPTCVAALHRVVTRVT